MREYSFCESLIGKIYIVLENNKLSQIHIGEEDFLKYEKEDEAFYRPENPTLKVVTAQLEEYFQGKRKDFSIKLELTGTPFQQSVWKELCRIPFGETRSYQDIATAIGNPKAVRAIGQANKANQVPVIIPCHRVIGKNQTLTGYAGKRTDIKEILLSLEGAVLKKAVHKGSEAH